MKTNKGFTLVEILVVVLIIGILSAIAVPRYEKAVWKSRLSEIHIVCKSLKQDLNSYLLTHNLPASNFIKVTREDLDSEALLGLEYRYKNSYNEYCADNVCYRISCSGRGGNPTCSYQANVYKDTAKQELLVEIGDSTDPGTSYCFYESDLGEYLCNTTGYNDIEEGF